MRLAGHIELRFSPFAQLSVLCLPDNAAFGPVYFNLDGRAFQGTLQFPDIGLVNYPDARYGSFYVAFQGSQVAVDCFQTLGPFLYGNIGEVDINRIAWHILMEQVDGRSSMHRKVFDAVHGRHYADKQRNLLFIEVIHIRPILWVLLFYIWRYKPRFLLIAVWMFPNLFLQSRVLHTNNVPPFQPYKGTYALF